MERRLASGRSIGLEVAFLLTVAMLLAVAVVSAGAAQTIVPERPRAGDGEPDIWPGHAVPDEAAAERARTALPFTQEQLRQVGALLRQVQRAVEDGKGEAPSGRMQRIVIEPGAGEAPQVIGVRHRWATVVDFRDATGSPWPVEDVFVDAAFVGADAEAPLASSNLVYLVPQRPFLAGNMVVKLRDLTEPVMLVLKDRGAGASDFGVEVRIPRPGPNVDAAALVRPGYFHAGDEVLSGLLAGRIPDGAVSVDIEGGGGADRGWRVGEDLLLLTRRLVLSPGPWAAERGSGGRWAYRLPSTPVVWVTLDGREHSLAVREQGPGLWGRAAGR